MYGIFFVGGPFSFLQTLIQIFQKLILLSTVGEELELKSVITNRTVLISSISSEIELKSKIIV